MDKTDARVRRLRVIASAALVTLYTAGLIAMFAAQIQLALTLWAVSTLGGIAMLHWIRKQREAEAAASKDARESEAQ